MKNTLFTALISLFSALVVYGQNDFRTLPGYNQPYGLNHSQKLVDDLKAFAIEHPMVIRLKSVYVADSKDKCRLLKTGTLSTDPFFKGKELANFLIKFRVTVYEFEYTGIRSESTTAANHVTIGMGSTADNYGTTTRTTDTVSIKTTVQIESAVQAFLANFILGKQTGLLFSNKTTTTDQGGKLYAFVYHQLEDACLPLLHLYIPVMVSTGNPKSTDIEKFGPHIYYMGVLRGENMPSQEELDEHMAEALYYIGKSQKPKDATSVYASTKLDHLTFKLNEGGLDNKYTVYVDGVIKEENLSLKGKEVVELDVYRQPGKTTNITIKIIDDGNTSGGQVNVTCDQVNVHSAFPFKKEGEEANIFVTWQ